MFSWLEDDGDQYRGAAVPAGQEGCQDQGARGRYIERKENPGAVFKMPECLETRSKSYENILKTRLK